LLFANDDLVDCGKPVAEGASGGTYPRLVPKEIRLTPPNVFTGKKSELENFLFEVRQYVDSVELGSSATACRFVVSLFKESALTWWRSFCRNDLGIFDHLTLDVLLDSLKS
jgi:hypothetical protein